MKTIQKKIENFRFRASELGDVLPLKKPITAKQLAELEKLEAKETLTARQEVRRDELREKAAAPVEFSQGAITFLRRKFADMLFDRERDFFSRYTKKGKKNEQEAINILSGIDGKAYRKNEERFYNDFLEGTPDIILAGHIIDVKNSWDWQTFPLLESEAPKKYIYQVAAYMWLTGATSGEVAFVLTDLSDVDIEQLLRSWAWDNDVLDIPDNVRERFYRTYRYPDVPLELRVKRFPVQPDMVDWIVSEVTQAHQLARKLFEQWADELPL